MLMDEDGKEALQSGQRGEMWLRGPNRMKGYWGNPKATAETITKDGWLQTGDIAYRDSSGKFYIVDRKKVGPLLITLAAYEHGLMYCG